jgi:hypothetical protein
MTIFRRIPLLGLAVAGAFAMPAPYAMAAQASKPPISTPSVVAPPTWWRAIPMPDGRTFVTDGGMSIDAALAKPAAMPEKFPPEVGKTIVKHLASPYDKETTIGDLRPGARPNTFVTPDGVILNGNYVTLLRSILSPGRTRIRTKGKTDPVVVTLDGSPVAVFMPIQPPPER